MKELCIPFTDIKDGEKADVEVRVPQSKQVWKYRIESINIAYRQEEKPKENKIDKLRYKIKTYDPNWELLQIYDLDEGSDFVRLLYRRKK
jgi:hypothetical protein